jgi:hypothetical protein
MGYSITSRFPNVKVKDQVLSFMEEHFRTWEELVKTKPTFSVRGPTDDVSYGPDDTPVIGFDYSGGDEEVQYCWRVCAWMAIIGTSQTQSCDECDLRVDCMTQSTCKLEVVNYDGQEDCPISNFTEVDEMGFWPLNKRALLSLFARGRKARRFDHVVKKELQRLTELWRSRS